MMVLIDVTKLPLYKRLSVDENYRTNVEVAVYIRNIAEIESIVVVQCKDCKHYHAETGFCNKHSYFVDSEGMSCSPAESPNWTTWEENDFCNYGERKDD